MNIVTAPSLRCLYCDCAQLALFSSRGGRLQCSCNGHTLCVVGFLIVAHMDLESFPALALSQTTEYPVAPSSVLDPSVYTVKSGVYPSAALFASSVSMIMVPASRSVAVSGKTVSSVRPGYPRKVSKLSPVCCPFQQVPVLSRHFVGLAHRLLRLLSWVFAGLSPDSTIRPPWNVVRKSPVEARASWLTRTCIFAALPFVPSSSSPFHHNSAPNSATA